MALPAGYTSTALGVSMRFQTCCLLSTVLLLVPGAAQAKDLRKRFGVGANAHLGEIPALSVRYGLPTAQPAINLQLEAVAGVWAYGDLGTRAVAGGRVLYGVVAEDNMNLFLGAGAGLNVDEDLTTVRIQPIMGADFFFFGLENLGFTAEWGLNVDVGDKSGASTGAAVGGGVHYWF